MDPLDCAGLCVQQLEEAITDAQATDSFHVSAPAFIAAMEQLEGLMGIPRLGSSSPTASTSKGDPQGCSPASTSKGGPNHHSKSNETPARPQTLPICHSSAIICKKIDDNKWCEGSIIRHDPHKNWCKTQCVNGDLEDMTHDEVKQHRKPTQQHSRASQEIC